MKKPELLIPAGNLETLKTAVIYGADAVYIGGEAFSLRARADNFDLDAMGEAVSFAHAYGRKVYLAFNIFAHNRDLEQAERYLGELSAIDLDALIISDPGIFSMARCICPGTDIHISTQTNSTNYRDFLFWKELGARRVVCARELSLEEIAEIRARLDAECRDSGSGSMEIEAFVHGSMCISYSGRCLLSAYMTGRSANSGACTHPCRWKYAVVEEKRPEEYYPVEEDSRGTYIFNSRDLCMIEHIPELVGAGIDSFKVEGRMKTELYVAAAARTYRKAIDDWFSDPVLYRSNIPLYLREISKCTHRHYTTGFYFGKPGAGDQIYESSSYVRDYNYLGRVSGITDGGYAVIEQKNKFCTGDEIEILKPGLEDVRARVLEIRDAATGKLQESCPHPRQQLNILLSTVPSVHDILGAYGSNCSARTLRPCVSEIGSCGGET